MDMFNKPIPEVEIPELYLFAESYLDEKLVYIDDYFVCDAKYHHWNEIGGQSLPGASSHIAVRESVVMRLIKASKLLPAGYKFKIYDGYRPLSVQYALWEHYELKMLTTHDGDLSESELSDLVSSHITMPSENSAWPTLHNTGGAIDVTIVDSKGVDLNMGCAFGALSDVAHTRYFETSNNKTVKQNRRLLYNVMTSVGFVNNPNKWWHYDYGNIRWAQTNRTTPLYDGLLDLYLKDAAVTF